MATFGGNTVEAAGGTGGPVFVFDTITALSALCSATKVVFGNDGEITAAWSFNTGPLDDGTPRVTLATDDPAVAALEAIESYLDTEVTAILTAVELIDNVVETDRFAVNLIAGQVGVAAGAGVVELNTPRVTLASDDPAVSLLLTIDEDTGNTATSTASSAASLAVIDDWDESDRCKVNLIPGQAGITAGSGGVSTNTPRTTLASDDPAVASLAVIDDWDESDRCKVNPIVGVAGLQGGSGTTTANTLRVTISSSDDIVSDLEQIKDGTVNLNQNRTTHDASVPSFVGMIGLGARGTEPTATGDGDATRALSTLLGKQVILPYAIPASTWQYASVSGGITDTADDVAKAAPGAVFRNYITHCSAVNASSSVSTEVVIKDGSTVIWRGWAQSGGGGISEKFDPPLRCTADTAVNVTNITTGAQTYFNLQGFVARE